MYALAEAIQSLLPVVDSFDRALHSPARDSEEFHAGIELINRQFHDALTKLGVEPIAASGEPFDPKAYLPTITGYYSTSKGDMLSFPFNSSSMVMWINKDELKKAGIAENLEVARDARLALADDLDQFAADTAWGDAMTETPAGNRSNAWKSPRRIQESH